MSTWVLECYCHADPTKTSFSYWKQTFKSNSGKYQVVRRYFYSFLTDPNQNSSFNDQYAFRPTGSTTAAIIALMHQLTKMLDTEPYVRLISLDFSRAFDTVKHSYLATILEQLPIPDHVYNWILALLKNRSHCTKFNGNVSNYTNINASIIQGSGMGPSMGVRRGAQGAQLRPPGFCHNSYKLVYSMYYIIVTV